MESMRMESIRMKSIRMNSIRMKSIRMESIRMKSIRMKSKTEKQLPNVFLTKRNGKCTQPDRKVVTLGSKCIWSNVNLGYWNMTIQL